MVIEIKLTQGKIAIVDDIDGDLAKMGWCAIKEGKYNINWYARKTDHSLGKAKNLHLHRLILERMLGRPLKKGEYTDHANHDGLDNRRANLRVCCRRENQRNRGILNRAKTGSGKGYYWNKHNQKWQAYFAPGDGTRKHIGSFDTEGEARDAYDNVAKKYYGEYAYTNADAVRDGSIKKIETPERIEIETLRPLEQRLRTPPWKQSPTMRKVQPVRATALEEA